MFENTKILHNFLRACLFIAFCVFVLSAFHPVAWGFFGHRKINRMAVFTLPPEMIGFYKKNIEYITEHAVDPDKRRYALKNEFTRHYIDIDFWDTIPFPNIPRDFSDATMKYGRLLAIHPGIEDTLDISEHLLEPMHFYFDHIYSDRYSTEVQLEEIKSLIHDTVKIKEGYSDYLFKNELVAKGALPYFLEEFYLRLVKAFESRDSKVILKISADIGHYVSDGHVPLHTTINYNGQLTDQLGIHAFWESRLPELFADESYDFIVGKAEYIEDIRSYIWEIITESHALLSSVLDHEKSLSQTFPEDQQYCFDERLERTIRTQCREYAQSYHDSMDGMVEMRMRDAIHAVASFWYSAWVDGGQPDLNALDDFELTQAEIEEIKKLENVFRNLEIKGRDHDN